MLKTIRSKFSKGYDLPLSRDGNSRFFILVIAIMTFLATLAFYSGVQLSGVTSNMLNDIEGKATVEIPAVSDVDGYNPNEEASEVLDFLKTHPDISKAIILDQEEIARMVAPWLGSDQGSTQAIPLPILISIEFIDSKKEVDYVDLVARIHTVSDVARLDRHEAWMQSVKNLASLFKTISGMIVGIIIVALVITVASGIWSRIKIYRDEVELLHLIGARDAYVAGQFQKQAFAMTTKGALLGFICGTVFYVIVQWGVSALLSSFSGGFFSFNVYVAAFLTLPLAIVVLSLLTTRFTVLKALSAMP